MLLEAFFKSLKSFLNRIVQCLAQFNLHERLVAYAEFGSFGSISIEKIAQYPLERVHDDCYIVMLLSKYLLIKFA